jgi:ribosomal protein L14
MKVEVIGKKEVGMVIQGSVRKGQEIVIRRKGKVERVVVVRTKRYTKTKVSYDRAGVIEKTEIGKKKGYPL